MKQLLSQYFAAYKGLPKQAWLLFWVILINRSGMMVMFFLTLFLTKERGFNTLQAGQLVSFFGIGSLAGSYYGGLLTDKIGTFKVQFYSLVLTGVGFLSISFIHSYWGLAVSLAIVSAINDAFRPASISAFTEICPPEMRARAFAFNRLAVNLGLAVGPAIGGFLAAVNYNFIFWADGATCIIAGTLFYILFKKYHANYKKPVETHENPAISPWKDGTFMALMGILLVLGTMFFQIMSTWPLYMREYAMLSENKIGMLLSINGIMITLVEMPLIHKLEKRPPLSVTWIGTLFMFSGFTMLTLSRQFNFIVFTILIWTLGEILVLPLLGAFVANRTTDSNRGQYMGIYTLVFSIGFVLSPIFGTRIYDRWGPNVLWYTVGIIGIFISFSLYKMSKLAEKTA